MARFQVQKIRATIRFGGHTVRTPDIQSFNVTRRRFQPAATFSASLKVSAGNFTPEAGLGEITIDAGTEGNEKRIFTGYVTNAKAAPCRTDPSKVILNLSGSDVMYKLQGRKITRRADPLTEEPYAVITGIIRQNDEINERFAAKHYMARDTEKTAKNVDWKTGGGLGVVKTPFMFPNRPGPRRGDTATPFTFERISDD